MVERVRRQRWKIIGKIGVAILAVSDDSYILSPKWADVVMDKIDTEVIIPSHYHVEGINIPHHYGLESAEKWTKQHDHTMFIMFISPALVLSPQTIASMHHHVMYSGDHVPFRVAGHAPEPAKELPKVPEPISAEQRFAPNVNQ